MFFQKRSNNIRRTVGNSQYDNFWWESFLFYYLYKIVSVQNHIGLPNSYPDSLRAMSLGKGVIFLEPATKSVRYSKAETPSFLAVSMIDK